MFCHYFYDNSSDETEVERGEKCNARFQVRFCTDEQLEILEDDDARGDEEDTIGNEKVAVEPNNEVKEQVA